jgi:hypothetical protein
MRLHESWVLFILLGCTLASIVSYSPAFSIIVLLFSRAVGPSAGVGVDRRGFGIVSLGLCCPLANSQLVGVLLPGRWLRRL